MKQKLTVMKSIFTSLLCAAFGFTAVHGQIHKGSLLLGGDLIGSTYQIQTGGNTYKQNHLVISPTIGMAISENIILGLSAGIGTSKSEYASNQYQETGRDSYTLGSFVRKYKPIGKQGFFIFFQGGVQSHLANETTSDKLNQVFSENKITRIGLNAYPGLSYGISDKFHLEAGMAQLLFINYSIQKSTTTTPTSESASRAREFAAGTSLSGLNNLYIGFRWLLSKKPGE